MLAPQTLYLFFLLFNAVFKQFSPDISVFFSPYWLFLILFSLFPFSVNSSIVSFVWISSSTLAFFGGTAALSCELDELASLLISWCLAWFLVREPGRGLVGRGICPGWYVLPVPSPSLCAKSPPESAQFLHLMTRMPGWSSIPSSAQATINKTSVGRSPRLSCPKIFVRAAVSIIITSRSSWA